jgi:hypothetical protein
VITQSEFSLAFPDYTLYNVCRAALVPDVDVSVTFVGPDAPLLDVCIATVAQPAEQPLRKRRVMGSIPFGGFSSPTASWWTLFS